MRFALGVCVALGTLRVFVYSAAFPFFNNVDEQLQFDRVLKWSHGELPARFEPMLPEAADMVARYGSPEFLMTAEQAASIGFTEPLVRRPENHEAITVLARRFQGHNSFESS